MLREATTSIAKPLMQSRRLINMSLVTEWFSLTAFLRTADIEVHILLVYVSHIIDRSHVTTAIWWPLGVAVVSVTCMRVCWISHTWKYTQWNIFLFESSDKSPNWTNSHHIWFRYEASLNFHIYFGQCPNDMYILLHIPLSCLSKLPAHGAYDCHGP